jgi:hypothetical protein
MREMKLKEEVRMAEMVPEIGNGRNGYSLD